MTLEELIAALRAATGPAYVLDEAIDKYAVTLGLPPRVVPPPYTASIDAALTLVPATCGWGVPFGPFAQHDGAQWWQAEVGAAEAMAATPAIALCIAALRARAAT
jgi:hypothetical protein